MPVAKSLLGMFEVVEHLLLRKQGLQGSICADNEFKVADSPSVVVYADYQVATLVAGKAELWGEEAPRPGSIAGVLFDNFISIARVYFDDSDTNGGWLFLRSDLVSGAKPQSELGGLVLEMDPEPRVLVELLKLVGLNPTRANRVLSSPGSAHSLLHSQQVGEHLLQSRRSSELQLFAVHDLVVEVELRLVAEVLHGGDHYSVGGRLEEHLHEGKAG